MALFSCPECGHQVSSQAQFCPNCGHPANDETRARAAGYKIKSLTYNTVDGDLQRKKVEEYMEKYCREKSWDVVGKTDKLEEEYEYHGRPVQLRNITYKLKPVSLPGPQFVGSTSPRGVCCYVGNLNCDVIAAELHQLFAPLGSVERAEVIIDRATGRSKGFGFVWMSSNNEAQAAIQALHHTVLNGRHVTVNQARPRA